MPLIKPSKILPSQLLSICLAISLLGRAQAIEMTQDTAELVKEGEIAASKNDWPKAYDLFSKACEKDDKSAVAFYDLGVAYLHMDNPQKAKEMEDKALLVKPDFVSAYIQLGAINAKLGDIDEAEHSLLRALSIDPKNPIAQESLNALRTFKGSNTAAPAPLPTPQIVPVEVSLSPEADKTKAVETETVSLLNQAKAAYGVGNLAKADDLLNKIIALDPQNSLAYSGLGVLAGAKDNYTEEVRLEDKALALDGSNAVAHLNLAWALARLERNTEALSEYEQVLKLSPDSEEAQLGKAVVLARLGNNDQAMTILDELLSNNPSSYSNHLAKGIIFAETNNNQLAESEIKKALELAPHQTETRLRLASFYLKSAQWTEAVQLYSQLAKELPDNATVWLGLGLALSKNGIQPTDQSNKLSSERIQALGEAVSALQKACSLSPKDTNMHLALGMALAACGKAKGASEELRQAWVLKPKFQIAAASRTDG